MSDAAETEADTLLLEHPAQGPADHGDSTEDIIEGSRGSTGAPPAQEDATEDAQTAMPAGKEVLADAATDSIEAEHSSQEQRPSSSSNSSSKAGMHSSDLLSAQEPQESRHCDIPGSASAQGIDAVCSQTAIHSDDAHADAGNCEAAGSSSTATDAVSNAGDGDASSSEQPLSGSGAADTHASVASDCMQRYSNTGCAAPPEPCVLQDQHDTPAALPYSSAAPADDDVQDTPNASALQSGGAADEEQTTATASSNNSRQPDRAFFKDGVRAIDVEVDCGPGLPCKLLHVTLDVSALQHSSGSKPFLGGFRHKQTGAVFHHASIQTPDQQHHQQQGKSRKPRKQQHAAAAVAAAAAVVGLHDEGQDVCWVGEKLTRETQTVVAASCSSQTVREAATQMAAPGLLLDCSGDRVLTPRPYVSSEVVAQWREAAALTIQRFSRGWFARKRAAVLQGIKAERDAFLAETAAESSQAALEHRRHEVQRRTHPLSKADFALLESELEAWRQQQTDAIKAAGLDLQEEQAALQVLLAKETRLLHTLDKLRLAAHQERRATGRQKQLGGLAQPKTWALSNGKKVLVHTPLTVRAAELQQLYRGLTLDSLCLDERLDVLLHVKWVAKEYDCGTTRELVELIDREADLLNRGRSSKTLDGLRKRIAGLFLTCCQNPVFNPEAARLRVNAVGANGPEAFEYVLE